MNFGFSEMRRFERMMPGERASLIQGKAILLTFIGSLLLLTAGTWKAPDVCTGGVFTGPMITTGVLLMLIFILGLCGRRHNDVALYGCYFCGLFIVILGLFGFVIFGYVAVGGIDLGPVRVREYNLEEYSGWLRGRVADSHYWAATSACLSGRDVCNGMTQLVPDPNTGIYIPNDHEMSPIESGCCKPSSSCAFTYVNGTTWIPTPGALPIVTDVNCYSWSNDKQTLCFQCDSCKAGFLDVTKKAWSVTAFLLIFLLIGLIFSCCIGIQYAW